MCLLFTAAGAPEITGRERGRRGLISFLPYVGVSLIHPIIRTKEGKEQVELRTDELGASEDIRTLIGMPAWRARNESQR